MKNDISNPLYLLIEDIKASTNWLWEWIVIPLLFVVTFIVAGLLIQ